MIEKSNKIEKYNNFDFEIDDVYDFVDENMRLGHQEVQYMYADLDRFLMTSDEVLHYYLQKSIEQREHPKVQDILNPFNYSAAYDQVNQASDCVYYDISKPIINGRLAYMPADIDSLKHAKKIEQQYLSKYPNLEELKYV